MAPKMNETTLAAAGAAAAGGLVAGAHGAEAQDVSALLEKIRSDDPQVRTTAWLGAGRVGAPALKPLAALAAGGELEVGRAAKRAMWKIVRDAGRPGADSERRPVVAALLPLLGDEQPVAVRREVLWMLSEIGGNESVDAMAALFSHGELREDARCALQRIPGRRSLAAFRRALTRVPEDFKINIAQSLRARGVEVPGYPCQKLVPTKQTSVKPIDR